MTLSSVVHRFSRWFTRRDNTSPVCLEVRPDGIAWTRASAAAGVQAGFVECLPAKRQEALRTLVSDRSWEGAPAVIVLPIDQYQVFQVERPEGIEDNELADALKWKLKDFLDFSPAEAVSDVFPFPEDASRGRGPLVNVVAARKSLVQELITLVEEADLELECIDIAELALRNLASRMANSERGVALVHLRERYGQMVVCRGDTLYLSRRLDVSHEELRDAGRQENAVQSLALEIQRSMDYFESQLGQVPPATIRLVARDSVLPLTSMLSSYVAANIETVAWSEFGLEQELDSRCVPAWGAGLVAEEHA
ncbi:biogenesis protein MshI [Marinobacter sp. VGCF2001]|uniref:biogenesis protein MshI n=1 Tax=Marinobacter sp. VGCF2001 TaxID=3417189 RepID=UPI003CFABAB3